MFSGADNMQQAAVDYNWTWTATKESASLHGSHALPSKQQGATKLSITSLLFIK